MAGTRLDSVLHYVRRVVGAAAEQGTDADLLARFVYSNDETAFELLLWRHAALVLRVCQSILRDRHAAEDAFQATFLALARKASSISRREALGAWLYQVAYRIALKARLDTAERRSHEARSYERFARTDSNPGDELAERDLVPVVHEELNRLSAKYRSPLVLCYLEGKTHAEAAAQLGWAKGTVSGRLARGREMLKKRLVRRGVLFPAGLLAVVFASSKASAVPAALVASTSKTALAFVAGGTAAAAVSAPVLHLTQGVLHAMFLSKMKATAAAVVACLLIFAGTGALLRVGLSGMIDQASASESTVFAPPRPPAPPQPPPDSFDPSAGPTILVGPASAGAPGSHPAPVEDATAERNPRAVSPPTPGFPGRTAGTSAPDDSAERKRRLQSINNLQQIAQAIRSYNETYGFFPADVVDEEDKPLLSWRVAILPFIGENNLYKQFKLDEPWDSPRNKKLLEKMPEVYQLEAIDLNPNAFNPFSKGNGMKATTYYQGFVGKGTAFDPKGKIRMMDFTDGTANTLLLVEAGWAVDWTKPDDIPYSPKKPIPALGRVFDDVIHAVFVDGSVHRLRKDFDQKQMHRLIVRDDGEVVDFDKLEAPAKKTAPSRDPNLTRSGTSLPPASPPHTPPSLAGARFFPDGAPPAVAPLNLKQLSQEYDELKRVLQQTVAEMESLRAEAAKLKDEFAKRQELKRQEQLKAQKLLAERDKLRQAVEQASAELKSMKDEMERVKRALKEDLKEE